MFKAASDFKCDRCARDSLCAGEAIFLGRRRRGRHDDGENGEMGCESGALSDVSGSGRRLDPETESDVAWTENVRIWTVGANETENGDRGRGLGGAAVGAAADDVLCRRASEPGR